MLIVLLCVAVSVALCATPPPPPAGWALRHLPASSSLVSGTNYTHPHSLSLSLSLCWAHTDTTRLFVDERCHLAWRSALYHWRLDRIISLQSVSTVTHVGGVKVRESHGALVLALVPPEGAQAPNAHHMHGVESGSQEIHALFKSCDHSVESYRGDLVAYDIDRLLGLHRIPATVFRRFSWLDLVHAPSSEMSLAKLLAIRDSCHQGATEIGGALIGWTKHRLQPVQSAHGSHGRWGYYFDPLMQPLHPPQPQLELSRYIIGLLVSNQPEKLHYDVMDLKIPGEDGKRLLVQVDNDQASWKAFNPWQRDDPRATDDLPLLRVCNRGEFGRAEPFVCRLRWTFGEHSLHDYNVAQLLSFLESACIWPERVVRSIETFTGPDRSLSLSEALERRDHLNEELAYHFVKFSPEILDTILDTLRESLDTCINEWGRDAVVFRERIYDEVDEAPLVHVDHQGRTYVRDAASGVWRRVGDGENGASKPAPRRTVAPPPPPPPADRQPDLQDLWG